jgi:hypothetical protein
LGRGAIRSCCCSGETTGCTGRVRVVFFVVVQAVELGGKVDLLFSSIRVNDAVPFLAIDDAGFTFSMIHPIFILPVIRPAVLLSSLTPVIARRKSESFRNGPDLFFLFLLDVVIVIFYEIFEPTYGRRDHSKSAHAAEEFELEGRKNKAYPLLSCRCISFQSS